MMELDASYQASGLDEKYHSLEKKTLHLLFSNRKFPGNWDWVILKMYMQLLWTVLEQHLAKLKLDYTGDNRMYNKFKKFKKKCPLFLNFSHILVSISVFEVLWFYFLFLRALYLIH